MLPEIKQLKSARISLKGREIGWYRGNYKNPRPYEEPSFFLGVRIFYLNNMKLWGNKWKVNKAIESFETRDDLVVDEILAPYDIIGTLAHIAMLYKKNIISKLEHEKAKRGLRKIFKLATQGTLKLQLSDEDIHTKIESYLTEIYGNVGKKIHTGRSRNDQVLTALRLLVKDKLLSVESELLSLQKHFLKFAIKYEFVPMPGYTHMQKAMPSSVGMWGGSFVEAFLDDLRAIQTTYKINDQSPLGSAAGYGAPIDLDRTLTAELLGFKKVQHNNLYCQNSRGKIEAFVVSALIAVLSDVNRFASDVLLFTMSEFNYFSVSPELCTGSSLMPQKKNVDVAELLRSKVKKVLGNYVTIVTTPFDLISGYNRDVQDIKKPLIEGLETTIECLKISRLLLTHITPNKTRLTKAITSEMFATHEAFRRVRSGISFRDAYLTTSKHLSTLTVQNVSEILRQSKNEGATGKLEFQKLHTLLQRENNGLNRRRRSLDTRWNQLLH